MSGVLIVEQDPNPTTDFFIQPLLNSLGVEPEKTRLNALPPVTLIAGDSVIFVRYLSPRWRRWVETNKHRLGQIIFFMDDDLFDLKAHTGLPLHYRWKLYRLAWRHRQWLRSIGAQLWVSTPCLAEKYADWNPRVLLPRSPYGDANPLKTLFYHGTEAHNDEIRWLYPVVEAVLKQEPSLCFEIIGDSRVHSLFSALPRVHVLHPMAWQAYQVLLRHPGRTIGLAPLLDNTFNSARSYTKFFDITRAGALGIYADHPVYQSIIRHQYNGLLLPMDQRRWVEAILQLSRDDLDRQRMADNAGSCLQ
ncbi:glycosyltransferase family protein [Zobellella maritima]|uniref:glycosyltransferase family 1 protein n=1 Tax=Zobellella maritima TaxID=2059725 RepID=UPI000E30B3E0|nr:glycosyltransferase family 1 protein [Zobellella maritima]